MLPIKSEIHRIEGVSFNRDGSKFALAGNHGVEVWSSGGYECLQRWIGGRNYQKPFFTSVETRLVGFYPYFPLHSFCTTTASDRLVQEPRQSDPFVMVMAANLEVAYAVTETQLISWSWVLKSRNGPLRREYCWRRELDEFQIRSLGLLTNPDRLVALVRIRQPEAGKSQNQIVVFDPDTGETLQRSRSGYDQADHFTGSPDGRWLAGIRANTLLIWNAAYLHRPPIRLTNDTNRQFTGLAFHPSGQYLATASNDKAVKLWDTDTWEVVRNFVWNAGRMRSIAFAPDGLTAVAGGDTQEFVVFDVDV